MYFPYLRGRQNELIALRELVTNDLLGDSIIPIIEPVKLSSTLIKTISTFIEKGRMISIIHNPTVGSFLSDMEKEENDGYKSNFLKLFLNDHIIKAHTMNFNSNSQLKDNLNKNDFIVINNEREYIDKYDEIFDNTIPKFSLIPDESAFKRRIKKNRVLLDDKFEKQNTNSAYNDTNDKFFSDDHLYYKDDGFTGFSDYSVVGNTYLEAGFAPYAVAIHIVYFTEERNLRIHHFVSDSNQDIKNPAKKFYEAVTKLSVWCEKNPNIEKTLGLKRLLEHYQNKTYPGLGSLKKLSIMHHLELMGKHFQQGSE